MANTKTNPQTDTVKRTRKGTTTRQRERLKGALLLLIPLVALIAALTRHVEPHSGEIPDWQPPPAGTEAH